MERRSRIKEVQYTPAEGFKQFNVTIVEGVYSTRTVYVPEDTTLDNAIRWANENKDLIPCDGDMVVSIDDDNCDFEPYAAGDESALEWAEEQ